MFEESIHSKISVLIPVYNVEKYVGRCLSSVLNQTMQEGVEVIIVNDCTPDHSMEVIFEALCAYSEKDEGEKMSVRVVNHDTNRGQASVRNTAMSYATGDYVIHVDSDDWIEPDMLEEMYRKAISTGADVVISDYWESNLQGEIYKSQPHYISSQSCICGFLDESLAGTNGNKLIKRSIYVNNDIQYLEDINLFEDRICNIRLFLHVQKIAYVSKAFYHYIQYNNTSITKHITRKNLNNSVAYLNFIETNLSSEYQDSVKISKVKVLCQLLHNSTGALQDEYYRSFKIRLKDVLRCSAISWHLRVQMIFIALRMPYVFNLILKVKRFLRRSSCRFLYDK